MKPRQHRRIAALTGVWAWVVYWRPRGGKWRARPFLWEPDAIGFASRLPATTVIVRPVASACWPSEPAQELQLRPSTLPMPGRMYGKNPPPEGDFKLQDTWIEWQKP